jgi:hypothetical protein
MTLVGAAALAAGLVLVRSQREEPRIAESETDRITQSGERTPYVPDVSRLRELGI